MKDVPGTVYLLHFLKPYRHARHYRGWAADVKARIDEHRNGTGARLMEVVKGAGIDFVVAKTEPGTRKRERQLKQRGASRDCPVCKQEKRSARKGDAMTDEEMAAGYTELLAEDDRHNGVGPAAEYECSQSVVANGPDDAEQAARSGDWHEVMRVHGDVEAAREYLELEPGE